MMAKRKTYLLTMVMPVSTIRGFSKPPTSGLLCTFPSGGMHSRGLAFNLRCSCSVLSTRTPTCGVGAPRLKACAQLRAVILPFHSPSTLMKSAQVRAAGHGQQPQWKTGHQHASGTIALLPSGKTASIGQDPRAQAHCTDIHREEQEKDVAEKRVQRTGPLIH